MSERESEPGQAPAAGPERAFCMNPGFIIIAIS